MFIAGGIRLSVVFLLLVFFGTSDLIVVERAHVGSSPYAEWAHYHWAWFSHKDQQANEDGYLRLIDDYLCRGIPVGAVDIDSEWSTGINNFVVDTNKWPNATAFVEASHNQGVRVILWATSMIDTDSSNYQEAKDNKYFVMEGGSPNSFRLFLLIQAWSLLQIIIGCLAASLRLFVMLAQLPLVGVVQTIKWWHGRGGLLDYSNPAALEWWHSQLDNVLDVGFDGFKTDGTDPFIWEYVLPVGHSGPLDHRQYADMYYGDFFDYSNQKRGGEALIMARPVDSFEEIVFLDFAPRRVVFSGWVGDMDATFDGLKDCLDNFVHSAWKDYVGFGCDIGGYRTASGPLGRTKNLFLRWAQVGAFMPLMENGGGGEHRPWIFDETYPGGINVTDSYARLANAHTQLAPYLYASGADAYHRGVSMITPMDKPTVTKCSEFDYTLGYSFFVAPIVQDGDLVSRSLVFPSYGNWRDIYNVSQRSYAGGSKATIEVPLAKPLIFALEGSAVPLRLRTSVAHRDFEFAFRGGENPGRIKQCPVGSSRTNCNEHIAFWYHYGTNNADSVAKVFGKNDGMQLLVKPQPGRVSFSMSAFDESAVAFIISGFTSRSSLSLKNSDAAGFVLEQSAGVNPSWGPHYSVSDAGDLHVWIGRIEQGAILTINER